MSYRRHWIALLAVIVGSFAVLGGYGPHIGTAAPPLPSRVVTADGRPLFDGEAVLRGQNVWQAIGGQEVGSVWGHGAYVAPDWTADWLHREARLHPRSLGAGGGRRRATPRFRPERQAALRERLSRALHENTYDPATGTIVIGPERAAAFEENLAHYADVFTKGVDAYAIPAGALSDPARLRDLAAFFWWTSWAAVTYRPGDDVTLHPELAARAARREPPDRRRGGLERRLVRAAPRRRRRARVVPGAGAPSP